MIEDSAEKQQSQKKRIVLKNVTSFAPKEENAVAFKASSYEHKDRKASWIYTQDLFDDLIVPKRGAPMIPAYVSE